MCALNFQFADKGQSNFHFVLIRYHNILFKTYIQVSCLNIALELSKLKEKKTQSWSMPFDLIIYTIYGRLSAIFEIG
jgi:hypothetical protein